MKLKDSIDFSELIKYGFVEDGANCEHGDHYYGSNNYYYEFEESFGAEFRLVVNVHDRKFEILSLSKNEGLMQLLDLDIILKLFEDGLIE